MSLQQQDELRRLRELLARQRQSRDLLAERRQRSDQASKDEPEGQLSLLGKGAAC